MCSRFRCPLLKNGNSIRAVLSTCSATGVLHETLCALLAGQEPAFGIATRLELLGCRNGLPRRILRWRHPAGVCPPVCCAVRESLPMNWTIEDTHWRGGHYGKREWPRRSTTKVIDQ